jgi:hypothetical protein
MLPGSVTDGNGSESYPVDAFRSGVWHAVCQFMFFHLSLHFFPYISVPDDCHLVMSDVSLLTFNFSLLNTIVGNRDTIFHLTSYSSVLSVQPRYIYLFYVTRGKILMPY